MASLLSSSTSLRSVSLVLRTSLLSSGSSSTFAGVRGRALRGAAPTLSIRWFHATSPSCFALKKKFILKVRRIEYKKKEFGKKIKDNVDKRWPEDLETNVPKVRKGKSLSECGVPKDKNKSYSRQWSKRMLFWWTSSTIRTRASSSWILIPDSFPCLSPSDLCSFFFFPSSISYPPMPIRSSSHTIPPTRYIMSFLFYSHRSISVTG